MSRQSTTYNSRPLTFADVMAIRSIFTKFFPNQVQGATYQLAYGPHVFEFDQIDKAKKHWKENGAPQGFYQRRWNQSGRETVFDGLTNHAIFTISANSKELSPNVPIEDVAFCLNLDPYLFDSSEKAIETAFIARRNNDEGRRCADELSALLVACGVNPVIADEEFTGDDIPDKVKKMIAESDLFFGIFVSHDDNNNWVYSETVHAASTGRRVIILDMEEADFQPGILGEDREKITFKKSKFSKDVSAKIVGRINRLRMS